MSRKLPFKLHKLPLAILLFACVLGLFGCTSEGSSAQSTQLATDETDAVIAPISTMSDSFDWSSIEPLAISCAPWGEVSDISATVQLCYSLEDQALYLRFCAIEPEVRATYAADDIDGRPWEDSCLEFFFSTAGRESRYLNIECNPNGCLRIEVGEGRENRVQLLPSSTGIEPVTSLTSEGWTLEYAVPFTLINQVFDGFHAESGATIYANFYKCGNKTASPHYLSWHNMTSESPDFHRPQDFGMLTLG